MKPKNEEALHLCYAIERLIDQEFYFTGIYGTVQMKELVDEALDLLMERKENLLFKNINQLELPFKNEE
jgi:hypothetical protein